MLRGDARMIQRLVRKFISVPEQVQRIAEGRQGEVRQQKKGILSWRSFDLHREIGGTLRNQGRGLHNRP